ncbi:DUF4157 domain-containing protein [Cyanobacteria bacterium FACHB-63]|nr:DUF4157 domain-containing protein [Cyanobacteria bacterium FACHB-63]
MEERLRLQRRQSSSDPVSIFTPSSLTRQESSSSEIDRSPSRVPAVGHDFSQISILPPVQAKLSVSQPNDPYEQEADRVADQVMRMQAPERSEIDGGLTERIDRKCAECEEEELVQTKAMVQRSGKGDVQVDEDLESRLTQSQGGGSLLPDEVRSFMEPRFGADFSQVRVHTDSRAVQMNRDLSAHAFTYGQDIFFGAGKTPAKDALTAHELTHVVQQKGSSKLQRKISTPLPSGVAANPKTGQAVFTQGGVRITILPDGQQQQSGAQTTIKYNWGKISGQSKKGVVDSFTGPGVPKATIQTLYGLGLTASSTSGYGRGTTSTDVSSGNTSLGFHEGNHGTDYLTYFSANPIPQFTGTDGMTVKDFSDAVTQWKADCSQYSKALEAFSLQKTDCIGTTIDQYNATKGKITTLCP